MPGLLSPFYTVLFVLFSLKNETVIATIVCQSQMAHKQKISPLWRDFVFIIVAGVEWRSQTRNGFGESGLEENSIQFYWEDSLSRRGHNERKLASPAFFIVNLRKSTPKVNELFSALSSAEMSMPQLIL